MPEAAPSTPSQVAEYLTNLGWKKTYDRDQMRLHIQSLREQAEQLNETNWLSFYVDCLKVIDSPTEQAIAFFEGVDSQLPLPNQMMAMELKLLWKNKDPENSD